MNYLMYKEYSSFQWLNKSVSPSSLMVHHVTLSLMVHPATLLSHGPSCQPSTLTQHKRVTWWIMREEGDMMDHEGGGWHHSPPCHPSSLMAHHVTLLPYPPLWSTLSPSSLTPPTWSNMSPSSSPLPHGPPCHPLSLMVHHVTLHPHGPSCHPLPHSPPCHPPPSWPTM